MILSTKQIKNHLLAKVLIKEANLNQSAAFKNEMLSTIDRGYESIIVDFEQVDYVDSSFLGALVSSLKYALAHKSDVSVTGLNKDIRNLFHLIRMDKVFKIYDRLPEDIQPI